MALLQLQKGRLCAVGQLQMCHLCGWLKLFLKKCGSKKNKKHWVGLNVGLHAVPLEYGLYIGHLSKWFVFGFMFKFWSVGRLWNGRPTIGYNVFVYELWRVSAQTFPDKNRLWKIRRIFQVRTDQAIAYILCCV